MTRTSKLAHAADRTTRVVDLAPGLRLAPVPGKGRGVFASRAFAKGEVVEVAPVLVLPPEQQDRLDGTVLDSYVFGWRDTVALCLGCGSLYNHAWDACLEYQRHLDECLIDFVAIRDIAAGEELTINYTSSNPGRPDLWADLA
ncbi:MAG: SET domain-containing protein [Myxococcota bacterium]